MSKVIMQYFFPVDNEVDRNEVIELLSLNEILEVVSGVLLMQTNIFI